MLFFLKKTLTFWLLPLPLCLTLLGLGLFLGGKTGRHPRRARCLMLAGFAGLLFFSNKAVSRLLILPLESRYPAIPELVSVPPSTLGTCRVIVVLGGGHGSYEALSATAKLSDSALGRLTEGVRLSRLLPAATLLVSGPSDGAGGATHASILAAAARSLGVDSARLSLIDQARDTEDEADAVADRHPGEKIALVTSAWHMPRAVALFKTKGLDVLPCPADFRAKPADHFSWREYGWDSESLTRSTMAFREYLGLLWLTVRGRI